MRITLPKLCLALQFSKQILDAREHRTALARNLISKWVKHSLTKPGQITIRIVDSVEGCALNEQYRNKKYATNVLTFSYQETPTIEADIVLCASVVAEEAIALQKTLQAHYAHLIVHGVLHAQGWDHENSLDEEREMQAEEIKILQRLGFTDPYATTIKN